MKSHAKSPPHQGCDCDSSLEAAIGRLRRQVSHIEKLVADVRRRRVELFSQKRRGKEVMGPRRCGETPRSPEAALKPEACDPDRLPAGRKRRILIVDDEETIRRLLRGVLEKAGYETFLAGDGHEAERMLPEIAGIELMIIDLVMPRREGIETISAVRKRFPRLKIIAISGAMGGAFLPAAAGLGANATLQKPIRGDELLEVVRRTLA